VAFAVLSRRGAEWGTSMCCDEIRAEAQV
jgi:hypothetical protein